MQKPANLNKYALGVRSAVLLVIALLVAQISVAVSEPGDTQPVAEYDTPAEVIMSDKATPGVSIRDKAAASIGVPVTTAAENQALTGQKRTSGWPKALGFLRTKEITIDGPRLTVNLPDKGGVASVTVTSGQALTPLFEMMKKLAFEKVHVKDGTFVFRTPSGFTQTIYSVNATISGDRNSSITSAKGRFKFRGEELSFEFSLLKPSDDTARSAVPISFHLKGEKLNAQLAGSISLSDGFAVDGKLRLFLPDLKFASAWLGYPLSESNGTARMNADGAFSWRGSVLSFIDAEFNMGDSIAKGAMSLDLAGVRPRLDGTMAFEAIDLSKQFIKNHSISGTTNGAAPNSSDVTSDKEQFLNENMDIGYLNDFDADFRLSANLVKLATFDAEDCAVTLTLKTGDLYIGLVESKVFGGLARGEIELKTIDKVRKTFLRADLENIEIETLVNILKLPSLVKGPAHVKVDLSGIGSHIEKLRTSISGEIKVRMDGLIQTISKNGTFEISPEEAQTLDWWAKIQTGSPLVSFENIWTISAGGTGLGEIHVKGENFEINGNGNIDLAKKSVMLNLRRIYIPDATDGADNGFNDQSSDQVVIQGPWSALNMSSDKLIETPSSPDKKTEPAGSEKQGAGDPGGNDQLDKPSDRG